jgi:hypothetical protein
MFQMSLKKTRFVHTHFHVMKQHGESSELDTDVSAENG